MKINPWRIAAAVGLTAIGVGILVLLGNQNNAGRRDFVEYWTVGQQLVRGENPYDQTAILPLQRKAGLLGDHPLISFSPPVAFFLVVPLGVVNSNTGLVLWTLVLVASVAASIRMLWVMNGRPKNRLHLIGYCFAPVMECLMAGQLGIFLLAGITLFLYFHKSRPLLAGAALLPCALKPHLFVPFALALLLWVISRRVYFILAGFAASLLISSALTLYLDRHIWSQYSEMMRTSGALHGWVPTLSSTFRFLVNRNAVWLEFIPEAAACIWATWFFWRRRTRWNWLDQGLLALLVSAACAPYAWFTDEAMLIPAILVGLYRADQSKRSLVPFGVLAGVAMIEVITQVPMTSVFYLWTTPAWLACFVYSTWDRKVGARGPIFIDKPSIQSA